MSLCFGTTRIAAALLLCAILSGCLPASQGQFEEEKESHYQAGQSCVRSMDFGGAIEEFEKAVEVNPHSASAHFQLGWLYEEKRKDPAAAIYHYQRFLKLRPKAENAEVVKQRVINCKQDLARDVLPLPVALGTQREFERLVEENKRLRADIEHWRAENEQLKTFAAGLQRQLATNSSPQIPAGVESVASASANNSHESTPARRSYVIRSGDTLASIARKHGVRLDALMAANPGLNPRRLRVGATVNLP